MLLNNFIDELFRIEIDYFQVDGRLRPLLHICAAAMLKYYPAMVRDFGPSNHVVLKMVRAAEKSQLKFKQESNPDLVLRALADAVDDDFTRRNAHQFRCDWTASSIQEVLEHQAKALASIEQKHVQIRRENCETKSALGQALQLIAAQGEEIKLLRKELAYARQEREREFQLFRQAFISLGATMGGKAIDKGGKAIDNVNAKAHLSDDISNSMDIDASSEYENDQYEEGAAIITQSQPQKKRGYGKVENVPDLSTQNHALSAPNAFSTLADGAKAAAKKENCKKGKGNKNSESIKNILKESYDSGRLYKYRREAKLGEEMVPLSVHSKNKSKYVAMFQLLLVLPLLA